MSEPKTQVQINEEIKALEACKTYAPKRTLFGDDNHAIIDLQIEALKEEIDITSDKFYEQTEDAQSNILEAINWRDGETEESPSSGWDSFKPKNRK